MSKNKLSKDTDLAAGFFSQPTTEEKNTEQIISTVTENKPTPKSVKKEEPTNTAPVKNVGGRPKKDGLKNEQFTLTMNPETYEKLRIVANEYTRGNFSGLIDEAIRSFCRERGINLADIDVDPEILQIYKEKQEKKNKKR